MIAMIAMIAMIDCSAGSAGLSRVPFTIFQYVYCTYKLDSLPENAKTTEVKV